MSNLPAPVQKWMTILLPPLALLVFCFVVVPRQNKLRGLDRDIKKTQANVQDYLMKLKVIRELPADPRIATLPGTRKEQSDFLRGLAGLCYRTGNRMLSVAALAAPPPPPPPPAGAPPPPPPLPGALPPDVTEIKSTIVFEGSFTSLRAFLAGLQRSRRLISLTDCRIAMGTGGYPNLQTVLTVARYVDAPSTAPAPPARG